MGGRPLLSGNSGPYRAAPADLYLSGCVVLGAPLRGPHPPSWAHVINGTAPSLLAWPWWGGWLWVQAVKA